MSTPTRELEQLSIGERAMSNRTRGQRRRREADRLNRAAREQPSALRNLAPLAPRSPPPLKSDKTGVLYQIQGLSSRLLGLLRTALDAHAITIDTIRTQTTDAGNPYLAFQTRTVATVSLYGANTGHELLECSCTDFQANPSEGVCAHIYRIYDGYNGLFSSGLAQPVSAQKSGIAQGLARVSCSIDARAADQLAERMNDTFQEEDDSDDVDEIISDMLAWMDDYRQMPWELREQLVEQAPSAAHHKFSELIVRGQLAVSVFALARHDPAFRQCLERAIPQAQSVSDFLDSRLDSVTAAFHHLDLFVTDGLGDGSTAVATCADTLGRVVMQLDEFFSGYRAASLVLSEHIRAVDIILRLVMDVCSHNWDIFARAAWAGPGDFVQVDTSRGNLFAYVMQQSGGSLRSLVLGFLTNRTSAAARAACFDQAQQAIRCLEEELSPSGFIVHMRQLFQQQPPPSMREAESQSLARPYSGDSLGQRAARPVSAGRGSTGSRRARTSSRGAASSSGRQASGAPATRSSARPPPAQEAPEPRRRRLE